MFFRRNISKLTDEELLKEYKRTGNADFFGTLYNRYIPLLYGVCLKYLGDAGKSEDAVMQLFEDLLPKVADYGIAVFRTWIYTVIKNHCLQILRKESKEILVDFSTHIMESDEILHLLNEEDDENERMYALRRCMEKLPEQQRACITYFFMDDMSYADISDATGYALSKVKSYIQNGKRNLKVCIDKHTA